MATSMLRVVSPTELAQAEAAAAVEQAEADARAAENRLDSLASHLRPLWDEAKRAKEPVRQRMMQCLRQRRAEYDPSKLADIKATGGSEIYMPLTSLKCRAAAAWLRDAVSGAGPDKPWTVAPTPHPDLPSDSEQQLMLAVGTEVGRMLASGVQVPPDAVRERIDAARTALMGHLREVAREKAQDIERVLEDQMVEGHFETAMDEFIDDFVTYPAAILKGPVVHVAPRMEWVNTGERWVPQVADGISGW